MIIIIVCIRYTDTCNHLWYARIRHQQQRSLIRLLMGMMQMFYHGLLKLLRYIKSMCNGLVSVYVHLYLGCSAYSSE